MCVCVGGGGLNGGLDVDLIVSVPEFTYLLAICIQKYNGRYLRNATIIIFSRATM